MKLSKELIASILEKEVINKPIIHYISDITKASDFSYAVRFFNGRSIMSYGIEEIHEITSASNTLLIGLETLDNGKILAMERALRIAKKREVAVLLDLTAVNLSLYRRNTALSFFNRYTIDVVKGNEEEVQSMIRAQKRNRCKEKDIKSEYRNFAIKNKVFLIVKGKEYYITDGYSEFYIDNNGEELKKKIDLDYIFTGLLTVAIGVAESKEEQMAALLVGIMSFSICCQLEMNLIKENDQQDSFNIKESILNSIKDINTEKIYDLGKISYEFRSKVSSK